LDHTAGVTDQKVRIPATQYCKDMDEENFVTEMRHLLFVGSANFGRVIALATLGQNFGFIASLPCAPDT